MRDQESGRSVEDLAAEVRQLEAERWAIEDLRGESGFGRLWLRRRLEDLQRRITPACASNEARRAATAERRPARPSRRRPTRGSSNGNWGGSARSCTR